jgi:hypothetical protein
MTLFWPIKAQDFSNFVWYRFLSEWRAMFFQVSLDELKSKIAAANEEFPTVNFAERLRRDAAAGDFFKNVIRHS